MTSLKNGRKTNAQNPTDSARRETGPAESAATPSTAPDEGVL